MLFLLNDMYWGALTCGSGESEPELYATIGDVDASIPTYSLLLVSRLAVTGRRLSDFSYKFSAELGSVMG